MMRRGFTLIEVLVASLLMSMLVMILTMVFSQSSIAWRTGKASVAEMDRTRRRLSFIQRQADDLLPGVLPGQPTLGRVVSAWNNAQWNGTAASLNRRAVEAIGGTELNVGNINPRTTDQAWQKPGLNFKDNGLGKSTAYVVGVWSYGPDGIKGTEDDITTWPDEMD